MTKYYPKVLDYVDGIGVHFYTDKFVPAFVLETVTKTHPEKFILGTEACEGIHNNYSIIIKPLVM